MIHKFGDLKTSFILWNDIQPGMAFIRPFEGILHFVEAVNLPFIHVRQSITGVNYVLNSWRGIQALDYNVQTEHEMIVEAFEEQAALIGREDYFDRFLTLPKLPDVALSCDQEDKTIRSKDIEMRNVFTEIKSGKAETGKTPLENLLFDAILHKIQREKSIYPKRKLIEYPIGDIDFQPKRLERKEDGE